MLARVAAIILVLSTGPLLCGASAAYAAGKGPPVNGMYLTTRYPAMTVRAGEPATIDLALRNFGRPPEPLSLSVPEVAKGWKATILGGGQPVAAAIVAPDSTQALQLRLAPPKAAAQGDYHFLVEAHGAHADLRLPITLTIGKQLPARLELTTNFPALRGTATTEFKFRVKVANDSGRNATINFTGQGPKDSRITFTQAYGAQEITGIPIKAGKSKDIALSIKLPHGIHAGNYRVVMHARSAAVSAAIPLTITVVGRPHLALTGEGDRLSGEAYAGEQSPLNLVVRNDGSAGAHDIRFNATAPDGWKTSFEPKSLPALLPGGRQIVKLLLTPSAQAIAGDYQTSISADAAGGATDSQNFRITVLTSTLWGAVGIAIIAAALLVVVFAVARFGRR